MKISDNVNDNEPDEPVVLVNAMHHAREVMTTEVAVDMIQNVASGMRLIRKCSSESINFKIYVVPMVNPDGNHKVWHSDSMWRKNARGGYGVVSTGNIPKAGTLVTDRPLIEIKMIIGASHPLPNPKHRR